MGSLSGVLYVGVTNDLLRRVLEHRDEVFSGFPKKYKTKKLLYYEYFTDINLAIRREKEIKKWRREKKENLINKGNEGWSDLFNKIKPENF